MRNARSSNNGFNGTEFDENRTSFYQANKDRHTDETRLNNKVKLLRIIQGLIETCTSSTHQEILCSLRNTKVHDPPLVHVPSHVSSAHAVLSYFSQVTFNIIFLLRLGLSTAVLSFVFPTDAGISVYFSMSRNRPTHPPIYLSLQSQ